MSVPSSGKRSFFETCALGIGGMVGGGIFVIMGEVVTTSGNATFISLGLGGILVLITGVVYGKLTVYFDEPWGGFTFIEYETGARFAGTVSWFLILGYIFTISLYAYAFGSYADHLLGLGLGPNAYLSSALLVLISLINTTDLGLQSFPVYLLSYIKIVVLIGLIIVGFFAVDSVQIIGGFDHDLPSIILGSALVFVGYEGFQLLTYRYDEIEDHQKNLPRAIFYCIFIVIAIYMLIAFVLTRSIDASTIATYKETVLALIAEPLLGQAGISIILMAAVFSTAFAVYATIIALSKLGVRVTRKGQMPRILTDMKSGEVPIIFTGLVTLVAICMQFVATLHQLTIYSSMIFLMIFSIVNTMGFKHRIFGNGKDIFPFTGAVGCMGAFSVLFYHTYYDDPSVFYTFLGIFLFLIGVRFFYRMGQ